MSLLKAAITVTVHCNQGGIGVQAGRKVKRMRMIGLPW